MVNQTLQDTYERLAELGQTVGTHTKKAGSTIAKQTVREATMGHVFAEKKKGNENGAQNHTPLDKEKMQYLDDHHRIGQQAAQDLQKHRQFLREFTAEGERVRAARQQEEEERRQQQEAEAKKEERGDELEAVVIPSSKAPRGLQHRSKVDRSTSERRGGSGKY